MPPLTSLLIIVPLAFLAGWVLSKAYFRSQLRGHLSRDRHIKVLKAQRSIYRRRIRSIGELVEQQKEASTKRNQQVQEMRNEIAELRGRTNDEQVQEAAARNELGLLQIERDELRARIKRLESEARRAPEKDAGADSREPELRAELGALKEKLAGREHDVRRLESQLQDSKARISELEANLSTWKHRVSPLAHQLQVQRRLLRKSHSNGTNPGARALKGSLPAANAAPDDLKRIRGIGPGLERRLHAAGIRNFSQLAALSNHQIGELAQRLEIPPSLPSRDRWVEQAKGFDEQN